MILRRVQSGQQSVDKGATVLIPKNDCIAHSQTSGAAAKKPSERFMRKPLQARSRASHSERIRVADLVNGLEKKMRTDVTNDGETKFKGYRPGSPG
jgi:hypothetical protein